MLQNKTATRKKKHKQLYEFVEKTIHYFNHQYCSYVIIYNLLRSQQYMTYFKPVILLTAAVDAITSFGPTVLVRCSVVRPKIQPTTIW